MPKPKWHVDSFAALDELPSDRKLTYEMVKAATLRAGRFSSFEASETPRRARFFTQLCRDPDVEITDLGFPWTGVKPRA
jgi:hypothetical protein